MKTRTRKVETCLLLAAFLLSAAAVFMRIPTIQAQDSLVLNENFESGWGSWLDYSTGATPTHTISINQSHSSSHSLWGTYGISGQTSIYKYFTPITGDMLFTFWSYSPNQNTADSFEQRIRISSVNAAGGIYLSLDNYDNNPKIELDWQSGYNSTSIGSSFSYTSWNNVTLYVHYSNGDGNGYAKLWFNDKLILSQTGLNDYNFGDYAPSFIKIIIDDGSAIGSYIDDVSLNNIGSPTPAPISTPTPEPTLAPTPTPTPPSTPTPTPAPTSTTTPTPTSSPSPTPIGSSPTPTPTSTPTTSTPILTSSPSVNPIRTEEPKSSAGIPGEYILALSIVGIAALSILVFLQVKKSK